jgi:Tfp pilus assembly protein PilN
MSKIDFVPNDYVQQRESSRANLIYLVLFAVMMGAIGLVFSFLKMQQGLVSQQLNAVELQLSSAKEQIVQLEELKKKHKEMMKTMVVTAELIEPIPRSIILADLTNNLPGGVSLLELKMEEETITRSKAAVPAAAQSKYQKKTQAKTGKKEESAIQKPIANTTIEMKGIAPSDIEVASYIARLTTSILMKEVALIESKEYRIEDATFREFKLEAKLNTDITLTKEDIERIRQPREREI